MTFGHVLEKIPFGGSVRGGAILDWADGAGENGVSTGDTNFWWWNRGLIGWDVSVEEFLVTVEAIEGYSGEWAIDV